MSACTPARKTVGIISSRDCGALCELVTTKFVRKSRRACIKGLLLAAK